MRWCLAMGSLRAVTAVAARLPASTGTHHLLPAQVKAVVALNDEQAFKMSLMGQAPEVAMAAALSSIQFCKQQEGCWALQSLPTLPPFLPTQCAVTAQQDLNAQLAAAQAQARINRTHQQARARVAAAGS